MAITERRNEVRKIAGIEQAGFHFVVIPNDAPAYDSPGSAWGVYDIERCEWLNFRATKTEAETLRDQIAAAAA
jgi:hypothetical protein